MPEREAYRPPQAAAAEGDKQSSTSAASQETTSAAAAANPRPVGSTRSSQPSFRRRDYDTADQKVYYTCGSCGKDNGFAANEHIRCRNCGGRIVYKIRAKRLAQYKAD
ncbi:hypothetical protein MFIFM68171_00972 [Madurella fahalii]|uniref:Uncharacterized protein n=1 Tax=Madurella fahalii TaxID=1157608 RepID=A0ABQ0FZ18_9PEZI